MMEIEVRGYIMKIGGFPIVLIGLSPSQTFLFIIKKI